MKNNSYTPASNAIILQSNLDYPDLDYPDFSIIRTFSLVPFFFMNINKVWSQKLSEVKNV